MHKRPPQDCDLTGFKGAQTLEHNVTWTLNLVKKQSWSTEKHIHLKLHTLNTWIRAVITKLIITTSSDGATVTA